MFFFQTPMGSVIGGCISYLCFKYLESQVPLFLRQYVAGFRGKVASKNRTLGIICRILILTLSQSYRKVGMKGANFKV